MKIMVDVPFTQELLNTQESLFNFFKGNISSSSSSRSSSSSNGNSNKKKILLMFLLIINIITDN